MKRLKKLWQKYMQGAIANSFPIRKFGLFGEKLKNPTTLTEAIEALDCLFSTAIKNYAREWSEEKWIAKTHHSIGRQIRNDWKLWVGSKLSKWFNEIGIDHPDDMSGIILTTYYRKIHDLPRKLGEQIQHYIEYWQALKP